MSIHPLQLQIWFNHCWTWFFSHVKINLWQPQYHVYLDVFEKKALERMLLHKPWDYAIDLIPDFKLIKSRIYPCSPTEQAEIDAFINDQLAKGYVHPSTSDQTSGVFFIPKKDGKKWMVQDYHYINSKTLKNNYLLPLIPELIDKIGDAKLFTKMDLQWGYNNVRIQEGNKGKAVFTCHRGTYEPLVMFFGLCNSPATFQTMMNDIFHNMSTVIVYIDDILIFMKTEEGHDEIVMEVLCRLKKNDLFVKPEKCFFKVWEVEMLGLIIGPNGIKMDLKKVKVITNWPIPTKVKEVQLFLGLANFYRCFVDNFSKIAKPLHKLMHKDTEWKWTDKCQNTFEKLKNIFILQPVLSIVDTTKPLWIESDTSEYTMGAVLSMLQDDGKWHPCAYLLKGFNDTKHNYDMHNKEMMDIMCALEAWWHYLEGCKHKIEIWTDHRNLKYFMSAKKLNQQQACWALYLSRFDFHLEHKTGSLMAKADALSRCTDLKKEIESDNKDVTLLKPEFFQVHTLHQGHLCYDRAFQQVLISGR